jgi:hypothetical protein
MIIVKRIFLLFLALLAFADVYSQEFFSGKNLSLAASFGLGKIQFYHEYTPVYIGAGDEEAIEYSPSWDIRADKRFYINNLLDFSVGLSLLTITEKTHNTAKPYWFGFNEKNLMQGFMHIIPGIRVKLPSDKFTFNLGLRMGTASFFGHTTARPTSNALGEVYADFTLESGFALAVSKRWSVECLWMQGLTKYDYSVGMPVQSITFFKYHSFLAGVRYILKTSDDE